MLLAHQPNAETRAAAGREHASIVEIIVDGPGTARGKERSRRPVPDSGGSLEACRAKIAKLQARHKSSGFDPQANAYWAHDLPEGGLAPTIVFLWILV